MFYKLKYNYDLEKYKAMMMQLGSGDRVFFRPSIFTRSFVFRGLEKVSVVNVTFPSFNNESYST